MIETLNGAFSFRDGKQRMKIDTEKLYNLLELHDDPEKPFGICGKKYMDKVEGNMHKNLSNKKGKTANMKKTVILRFRFSYVPMPENESSDSENEETVERVHRYVTITIFQHDAIGFAGCKSYVEEPMAIRDQIKEALESVADQVFSPVELFKRKPSIVVYNSTFEVPEKVFIIDLLKEFLDETDYEIVLSAEITQRGLHIKFVGGGALIVLIKGKNKVFGIRSEQRNEEITKFVEEMYAAYDKYAETRGNSV